MDAFDSGSCFKGSNGWLLFKLAMAYISGSWCLLRHLQVDQNQVVIDSSEPDAKSLRYIKTIPGFVFTPAFNKEISLSDFHAEWLSCSYVLFIWWKIKRQLLSVSSSMNFNRFPFICRLDCSSKTHYSNSIDWTLRSSRVIDAMTSDVIAPSPWKIFGCENGMV